MCGICGIVGREQAAPRDGLVRAMTATLTHRGPDEDGFFCDTRAALGMRRLSIIDLDTGTQPMSNEDGSIQVVFNGEIYNYRELRDDLITRGHTFRTQSDTEVLPHLYEEYGDGFLQHLNGMFGLAIWDSSRSRLLLARDRLGIKPLYYAPLPDRLVFGSELKAILAAPGITREIDPVALNEYLTYEYVPPPRSIFNGIKKLAPGEMLVYENGEAHVSRYWDFPSAPPLDITFDDAAAQLRELIRDAVRVRLVSDVPLGVFLSGGVDSTTTAAFAAQFSPRIESFCIGFEEQSFDESRHARRAADIIGTTHHEDILPLSSAIGLLPDVFDLLDEPMSDPSLLPTFLLSRFTRRHVTVALSGDGGDELFAGYPTYQAHRLHAMYSRTPAAFRAAVSSIVSALPSSDKNLSLDFKLKKFLGGEGYGALERQFVWLGPFAPHDRPGILSDSMLDATCGHDLFETPRAALAGFRRGLSDIETAMLLDLRFYLGENLMTKVDRASMMCSLEARTPLLDHRVVEFAAQLPVHFRLNGWKTKYILKKAVARDVPLFVIKRKKKGFGIPLTAWIRKELRPQFEETLSESRLRADGLFNPSAVRSLLDQHMSGRFDHRKKLWNLFVLHQWMSRWT